MIKSIFLFIFIIPANLFSQNLSGQFINSEFTLTKVSFGNSEDVISEHAASCLQWNKQNPKLKMKCFVYDTSKVIQKATHNIKNFKHGDTLVVGDWDLQDRCSPQNIISKVRFADSLVVFYTIYSASKLVNNKEVKPKTRSFKFLKTENEKIILLDLDHADVPRKYYLKRIK